MSTLPELREKIDETDRELLQVLAKRFALCHEVAEIKGVAQSQVLQPTRVQDVLRSRTQWALDMGIEPGFAELLFRTLLAETHRIEAVHMRNPEPKSSGLASHPQIETALQTTACRLDHVTVAVENLEAATTFFVDRLGFQVVKEQTSHPDFPGLDSVVVDAGGVTFVLMQAAADRAGNPVEVGVHHIAIEVLNAAFVRNALAEQGCSLQTDVLTSTNGLERFFTVRDASSGLQLGFVSRIGDRSAFDGGDVQALSAAIEQIDHRGAVAES